MICTLPELGGKLLDTAPAYGQAEAAVGELVAKAHNRDKLFLATKVSVRGTDASVGAAQMAESYRQLQTDHLDLMQAWNVGGIDVLLPVLREMKAFKQIRTIGVTPSRQRQYAALEALMRRVPSGSFGMCSAYRVQTGPRSSVRLRGRRSFSSTSCRTRP